MVEGIPLPAITPYGEGLVRPECVLTNAQGTTLVSHGEGGVSRIDRDGSVTHILANKGVGPADRLVRPNGIAVENEGSFLLAHLGDVSGGIYRLSSKGEIEPAITQLGDRPLPPTNFVLRDAADRLWITVSTSLVPRDKAYSKDWSDGFILLQDKGEAKLVAEGLGYTNEVALSADGDWLYVNETFSRRLTRFPLRADGSLGPRELVAEFGPGSFPDGMAIDEEGGIWIVCIVSNRVLRVSAKGRIDVVVEDCDPEHIAWTEQAYQSTGMGRPHLDQVKSKKLRNISSIAFGGTDRRQAFLGCLLGEHLMKFDSSVAGLEPAHWKLSF